MTSCQTTTKVIYKVPDLDFPVYPNPKGKTTYDESTNEVKMDLSYYEEIFDFQQQVKETERVYKNLKALWEGQEYYTVGE